jgi:hypothetical protein
MKDIERKKLIEAVVFFTQNTRWCGSVKLFKLLFFLDMLNFRETGRSVTGLQYTALPMGPVPTSLLEEFRALKPDLAEKIAVLHPPKDESEGASKLTKISPKEKWTNKYLTVRETRIAEDLAEIFLEATSEDMSNISHAKGGPWERAKDRSPGKWKGIIDYLDSLSPSLKMGRGKAKGKEELKQRAAEFEEARQFFK